MPRTAATITGASARYMRCSAMVCRPPGTRLVGARMAKKCDKKAEPSPREGWSSIPYADLSGERSADLSAEALAKVEALEKADPFPKQQINPHPHQPSRHHHPRHRRPSALHPLCAIVKNQRPRPKRQFEITHQRGKLGQPIGAGGYPDPDSRGSAAIAGFEHQPSQDNPSGGQSQIETPPPSPGRSEGSADKSPIVKKNHQGSGNHHLLCCHSEEAEENGKPEPRFSQKAPPQRWVGTAGPAASNVRLGARRAPASAHPSASLRG